MVNPTFKLRKPRTGVPVSIYLSLYYKSKKFVYGTGKLIVPELWNDKTARPITRGKNFDKLPSQKKIQIQNIKNRLENISVEVQKYFSYCEQQNIAPSPAGMRARLDAEILGKVATKPTKDVKTELNEFITEFIEGIETGQILTEKGKRYTVGTIKNYKGFQTQFNNYQSDRRKRLKFTDITIDFYDDYVAFFNSKNYSPNTIGRHIKGLKVVMGAAFEKGLHNNTEFRRKKFKTIEVETDAIYLNIAELNALAKLDLSKEPHMELVRDVFLVGCYTAQRYSDYSRISPEHIRTTDEGTKVIELQQQKTKIDVVIPIGQDLDRILKKYDYKLPKTYSQKVNDRIKILGRRAGITKPTSTTKRKNGFEVRVNVPKCELIKTHTARRSGATNMYKAKIPSIAIMKITGHQTEREFLKYIKVGADENANRLALHPFFNQAPLRVAK